MTQERAPEPAKRVISTLIPKDDTRESQRRLGPYRLARAIGAGAAGRVFEAVDDERGLRVALKTLPEMDAVAVQQLKAEFRNVASAEHRNLLRHYELMEAEGAWFFTMELLSGVDLASYCAEAGQVGSRERLDRIRRAFAQLASGIAALHQQGLLHLDIKPANVFVEPDERVVLLDFGIARRTRDAQTARVRYGTPRFMAPEQLRGQSLLPASDWYAFGLMLFEALSGVSPRGEDPYEALDDPERVDGIDHSALPANLPAALKALCLALLHGDPSQRPTATEVLESFGEDGLADSASVRQLVGRASELDALRGGFAEVLAGASMIAHVVAESGLGKSTLVTRFLDEVRSERALVLAGRCYEWESVPYKGLDAAVDELSVHLHQLGSQRRAQLDFSAYDRVATLFPVLSRFRAPVGPAAGDEIERRAQAFQAFRHLLRAISVKQPIVCFIDDAHWSDADSARLLLDSLSFPEPPRVLLILAYRPAEAERSEFLSELRKAVHEQEHSWRERRVELLPLSDGESCRLAGELLGEPDDTDKCRKIAREAQGNPFFVEELVRAAKTPEADLGSTLDEMLHWRIARLPEEARRVLEVVAVAGRLPEQDLALLAGGVSANPHRVLGTLRAASLVRTSGPRKTDGIEPYHDRIRESLMRTLAGSTLTSVHRALATILQDRADSDPHVLSVHFEGAGEIELARRHAVIAAERASAVLAFERAASAYERALRLGAVDAERASLLEARGRALFDAGRGAEAGPLFLEAAQHRDVAASRRLRRQAVESFLTAGHVRPGVQALVPLCAEIGLPYHASNARATLSVLNQLARLYFSGVERRSRPLAGNQEELQFEVDVCWAAGRGLSVIRPAQGLDLLLRGLLLAAKLGEPHRLARSLTLQGSALVAMGGPLGALGARWLARAGELADERDDPYLRGLTDVFFGFAEIAGAGRWPLAMEHAERGMQTLQRHCTGVGWERDMGMAVWLKAFEPSGDVRSLGVKAAEWAREAAARGDVYTQNVAASFIVPQLIAEGDLAGARHQARVALADWHDIGYTVQHYHATRLEACCDLYSGDAPSAWRRFLADLPRFKETQLYRLSLSRIELLALEGVIRLSLAASKDGKSHRAAAKKLGARLALESRNDAKPHAAMINGSLAVLFGDRQAGIEQLSAARDSYLQAAMPNWSWSVTRRLAELAERHSDVQAADAWFTAHGVSDPQRWVAQFVQDLRHQ